MFAFQQSCLNSFLIMDTANSLIENDTFYTMSLLKKGASHGYRPRSLLCCICNCALTKNSTSSRIQVFSCGHTAHLQCELQEKEASQRDFSAGCPICKPKRKALSSKSRSALTEDGLVCRYLSRNQTAQGTIGLHQHERDIFEGSYDYHPISRFEILTNLQKERRLNHVENPPQLRLAPPAVYHEKVKKGIDLFSEDSSGGKVQKGIDASRGESSIGFAKM